MDASFSLSDLIYLMQRLRKPGTGCPWDLQQNYVSITPSTIEEAYEVVDAIEREDFDHLKEELGDLLFQVIFYAQMASEEARFDFHSVVHGITAKLLRRHPHVFPDGTLASERSVDGGHSDGMSDDMSDEKINASWERIKQGERNDKGEGGVFDDVPRALPGLARAAKLQKRASKFGFDWAEPKDVMSKLKEECDELEQALGSRDEEAIEDELGDVLFTCVNLARHMGKEPETLIRQANKKFERRVTSVDRQLREASGGDKGLDSTLGHCDKELALLWDRAKREERGKHET